MTALTNCVAPILGWARLEGQPLPAVVEGERERERDGGRLDGRLLALGVVSGWNRRWRRFPQISAFGRNRT